MTNTKDWDLAGNKRQHRRYFVTKPLQETAFRNGAYTSLFNQQKAHNQITQARCNNSTTVLLPHVRLL